MEKESIKIEDMNYAQLDALEKLIKAQKKKVGGAFHKCETGVYHALLEEFKDDFPGILDAYGNAERSIYYICDFTLGNYKHTKLRRGKKEWPSIRMNGSVVNTNIDPVAYKNMVNDILKVIKKHHKKEANDD